ncbi:MAG: 4Fe-4S ferredoxin, partial [Acholeplasmataceae bacterium]|nr:4Fe-4S ferredoxin [Acholeplasmataceae bacterium]
VCPQGIRLDLLNRKLIKDINELYGEYRAGADAVTASPLLHFEVNDVEPGSTAKGSE